MRSKSFTKKAFIFIPILILAILGSYVTFFSEPTAAWYEPGGGTWTYRLTITIDPDQVDDDLTDFPVYVDLSDLPAEFHTNVRSDGGDIRVTTSDGTTEVPREVVVYDAGTDTGELHFKAPTLSDSTGTTFYIYYGNSSATDYTVDTTYGAENVWTNGYVGVWHMGNVFGDITELPSQQIGVETPSGAYYTGTYGMEFTTTGDIILGTTTINANIGGSTTFVLYKFDPVTQNPSAGTLVDSVVVEGITSGVNEIVLNLQTNGPGSYWLGRSGTFSLMRSDAGQAFPFTSTPGGVTFIQGRDFSSAGVADRWYYFYNLQIEGEVTVVNPVVDSTNGDNTGVVFGGGALASGMLNEAVSFVGVDSVQVPNSTSFDLPGGIYTLSVWVRPSSLATNQAIIDTHESSSNPIRLFVSNENGTVKIQNTTQFNGTGVSSPSGTLQVDTWSYIHAVVNGTSASLFHNGSQVASGGINQYQGATTYVGIGNKPQDSGSSMGGVAGIIDEVRISSSTRASTWISTEYNNQNSPNTFYSVGTEEENTVIPTVTTSAVTSITATTATGNGNVTDDGGATITERGVVWNTTGTPTTADSNATSTGTTGAFTASMTGLTASTLYYVRAYAINSEGTSYGSEVTFTTSAESGGSSEGRASVDGGTRLQGGVRLQGMESSSGDGGGGETFICGTSTVDDADANTYSTLEVGDQCWMGENLRVGTRIAGASNQTNNGTIEKYCSSDNDSNCITDNPNKPDGGLYQWNEAMQYSTAEGAQGICPAGWHIPTDNEFYVMENFLDSTVNNPDATGWRGTDIGTKLKPNGASGFEFNLAGYRLTSGSFSGANGALWSSSVSGASAWYRQVSQFVSGTANRATGDQDLGFSVRCLKD